MPLKEARKPRVLTVGTDHNRQLNWNYHSAISPAENQAETGRWGRGNDGVPRPGRGGIKHLLRPAH